ncbi:hypothetical protein ACFYNO_33820 [Kitasatospora sp. NPDC006697]|uniref:hypothetical protein n=1 Tax=Kitasatospora sp. NPDC006697 TaxID=3364020 RepID=UPI0036AC5C6A
MSENLNETSDRGAEDSGTDDATRGRHRGVLATDDTSEASPHGRHRLDAAAY